jgi:iduronate 2-sulfatase
VFNSTVPWQPHLPFVSPAQFFESYPLSEIQLPGDQNPPKNMPSVAWSNWGEMRAYIDIDALNNTGNPGDILPSNVTLHLRRAYYASVSYSMCPSPFMCIGDPRNLSGPLSKLTVWCG